jgi:hypothetical protein
MIQIQRLPDNKLQSLMIFGALFFISLILLVFANRFAIYNSTIEIGDAAANSILVNAAKDFSLLTGNYSRLGFNHPGPFILYFLAFGEYVFFDFLKLLPSPIGAQLFSVAIYNSLWIVLFTWSLYQINKSVHLVFIALSTFIFISALNDYQFFNGLWFPHLYYFPFATFLVSLLGLLRNQPSSVILMSFSIGVLINGHVAFGIICPLITIFSILIFLSSRSKNLVSLSGEWLNKNKFYLYISLIIFFLFLLPIITLTVLNFPGPIHEYLTYGGQHKANAFSNSIAYVARYWGGLNSIISALVIFFLFARLKFSEYYYQFFSVISSSTIVILLYVIFGIDDLSQDYICLFYFTIPSLFLIFLIYQFPISFLSNFPVKLLSIFLIIATFFLINRPPLYMAQYNQPDVANIYNALNSVSIDRRVVINLDNSNDWPYVWSKFAGVAAFAVRKKTVPFCINQNWHILFTKSFKCSSDEIDNNLTFFVKKSSLDNKMDPDFVISNLSFYRKAGI